MSEQAEEIELPVPGEEVAYDRAMEHLRVALGLKPLPVPKG